MTEYTPSGDSQHVLKAEAARPDATDREAPAIASPMRGGALGTWQPAAAGPAGSRTMPTATLPDGRDVDTSSEDWRVCCEARAVLAMPAEKRRAWMIDCEVIRGRDATKALIKTMDALQAGKGNAA